MTLDELHDLALAEQWRDGADEALWVLDHLDGNARSLPESETRVVLAFAGLPDAAVNCRLSLSEDLVLIGDLVYVEWRTVVEYEGAHHQRERGQYVADIDRYATMRRHHIGYVQVTAERLGKPRTLVGEVYRELVEHGYDGAPPVCGPEWAQLWQRVTDVLGPRSKRRRPSGASGTDC